MICIVYELLYDNYMGITWQLYVKYKVITRMAFSIAKRFTFREISSSWQNVSKLPFAHLT
jgi:hypothetical protein